MATRHALQEQNRGEAMEVVNKQKNMAVEKAKSRRALGDIGNLVTLRQVEGKPLPQITRPVTRSFCAQLIANAQKDAAENKKKPVVNVENLKVGGKGVAAKKKATVKLVNPPPPTATVIEISPDTQEEKRQQSKSSSSSRRKKNQSSLTSTMTARSMAVCGLDSKSKLEQVTDIDALDVDNELAVVEYVEDIYKFYKSVEDESRVHDYMPSQPEINDRMRAILIDWLIELHDRFELANETLYLTINIVDRFLAAETVVRRELQCVGMSAMLIASKYEEIWAPEVNDFVQMSDRAYDHQQVLVMEKRILGKLEWNLTVPTTYVFLARFIKASSNPVDPDMENMVYFLAELGVMNYDTIRYCPSMIAASAVYAARCTLNKNPIWNATLKLHTGYSESQLMQCAKLMAFFHQIAKEDQKRKVIFRKYSSPQRKAVALFPPAKSLLASLPLA